MPADAVEGVEDAHGSVAILYPDHRVIFYQGALRRETATQRVVLMANVGAMVEAGRWTSRPSNQIEASMKICGLVNVIDRAAGGPPGGGSAGSEAEVRALDVIEGRNQSK